MIAETLEQQQPGNNSDMSNNAGTSGIVNAQTTTANPATTTPEQVRPAVEAERSAAKTPAPTSLTPELERSLVQVFKLLSDETRLRILLHLHSNGELHVSALCERLKQSQPAVSHHLALLRVAGLIEARRDGKHNFYSVRAVYLEQILASVFEQLSQPGDADLRMGSFLIQQNI